MLFCRKTLQHVQKLIKVTTISSRKTASHLDNVEHHDGAALSK